MAMEVTDKIVQKFRSHADEAWKDSISLYFKDFMKLCWPRAYREINWSKPPEFLEQELQAIMPDRALGKRVTDKIVKVWLIDGREAFLILHIEVQGSGISKAKLTERMMIYRYRIFDRHRAPVASLAILIDDSPTWRPDTYCEELWDSVWLLKYPILKILDYRTKEEELLNSPNPFAMVILAQLGVIETRKDPKKRYNFKLALTEMFYEKGWDKQKILDFYKFIDGLLALPLELKLKYNEAVKEIERERKVSYITTAEWCGRREGRKEGRIEGRVEGQIVGRQESLISILDVKFNSIPEKYVSLIHYANETKLKLWVKRACDASSIEEVFIDA